MFSNCANLCAKLKRQQRFIMENAFVLPVKSQNLIFHHVQSGDTLSGIIRQYHTDTTSKMSVLLQQVLADNPNITNADHIQMGQLVAIRTVVPQMCMGAIEPSGVSEIKQLWNLMDTMSQDNIKQTSGIYNMLSLGMSGTGTALFTLEHTLKSNMGALNGIPDDYAKYKRKEITKYQFDKLRSQKLNSYAHRIGPGIEKLIYGDGEIKEAFKLTPGRAMDATKPMVQHLNTLKTIGHAAEKGGMLLMGLGLAASCFEIMETESLPEKNEIAVKSIVSTIVGMGGSYLVGVYLVATPMGWFTALGIGLIAAGVSMGAGEIANNYYSSNHMDIDIVNTLGISRVCH